VFVPTKIVEIKCRSAKNTLLPKKLIEKNQNFRKPQKQNSTGKEFETEDHYCNS
jgi:hypothetical protein